MITICPYEMSGHYWSTSRITGDMTCQNCGHLGIGDTEWCDKPFEQVRTMVEDFIKERFGSIHEDYPPKVFEPGFHAAGWTIGYEGAYDWTVLFSAHQFEIDDPRLKGLFVEPVNGWCLGIYPKQRPKCESTVSENHSDDLLEVWAGKPSPRYVCGYHAEREGLTW
jgi:hypothetical protein